MKIKKNCVICGVDIFIRKSHAEKEGTYCSRDCMSKGYTIRMKGESNPNYRHGLVYTREYRKPYELEWRQENLHKVAAYNRNMKAKRKNATGSHSAIDIDHKLKEQNNCCYWCLEFLTVYEVDHIIPLSKNGSNCKDNIVISCVCCNREKRDKLPLVWLLNSRVKRKDCAAGRYSKR